MTDDNDTEMVQCPAEGCDYGPKPRPSVKGHWGGKRDNAHTGAFHKAMKGEDPRDHAKYQSETENETETTQTQSKHTETQTTGGNPTMGSGSATATQSNSSADSGGAGGEKVELPCGHESFDPSQVDFPKRVKCDTCSSSWVVKE